jgi:hypothetical protein
MLQQRNPNSPRKSPEDLWAKLVNHGITRAHAFSRENGASPQLAESAVYPFPLLLPATECLPSFQKIRGPILLGSAIRALAVI